MRPESLRFLSLLLALTLAVPPAYAGSVPKVVVPPMQGGTYQSARKAIVQAFSESARVTVVNTNTVDSYLRGQKSTQVSTQAGKQAAQLLDKGKKAYRNLEVKKAVEFLRKAKQKYRNSLFDEASFAGLRAAQFHLAMAHLGLGEKEDARDELMEVVLLDPDRGTRKLSEKLYSPDIRKLYDQVRKEVAQKPHGDLVIVTSPRGALTYVDGKGMGAAGARGGGLPLGEHFVQIKSEGRQPHFGTKFIVEGENQFSVDLKPLGGAKVLAYFAPVESTSQIDHSRTAFLDESGLQLGADVMVFLAPADRAVSAQLYDLRSQEVSPVETDTTPQGLVLRLLAHLSSEGYVQAKPDDSGKKKVVRKKDLPKHLKPDVDGKFTDATTKKQGLAERSEPWYNKWWVWAAVGGVLLAAGGSVLLFTDVAKSGASSSTLTTTVPGR